MAAVRYTVLTSHMRFLVKNNPSRLTINLQKVRDIGTRCPSVRKDNKRLLPTYSNPSELLFRSNILTRYKFNSCLSKFLTPEITSVRHFSSANKPPSSSGSPKDEEKIEYNEKTLTVFQRFKKTYKEHGKILIVVHLITSTVWFGSFYMAAVSGVDIVPWMEKMGFSDTIIKPFRTGGLGYVALAYLMYKLATPARYTVTLGGTNMAIRYLRKTGKMEPIPEGHSIRNLYKDGKNELRDRQLMYQQRRRTAKIRKERVARNRKH